MHPRTRLARSLAPAFTIALVVTGCSTGGSNDAAKATTTTKAEATTTTDAPTTTAAPTTTEPEAPDGPEGGVIRVGDKLVFLDGFIGVKVPQGWDLTSTAVPTASKTPPGGETEMDPDALVQVLVLNPIDAPRDATFALLHYEHSDSVPDLEKFTAAVKDLLSEDGSQVADGTAASIGGQSAQLHQVRSARGQNGLMVTLESGGEYFVVLTLAEGDPYPAEVASMLSSVSFEPNALHS